ncbi:DNA primase, phage associated [hydrothermal vent metagenome]|uniref:DNA primase, phage associated n=1 Tax=hydrothermal vent metagenome TaxID=652676 RepID=A0A3B1AK66_9ZZZZ
MARIAEEEINRLKEAISLMRLVESQGYQPKKQGKDYVIRCPFHDDKTPSLVITPAKNLYHCFGCGAAGSVIDWIMKTQEPLAKLSAINNLSLSFLLRNA